MQICKNKQYDKDILSTHKNLSPITFNLSDHNYIVAGLRRYFYFFWEEDKGVLIADECPHRQGPLHLARRKGQSLECPWHQTCILWPKLRRQSFPTIRMGNMVKAFLPIKSDEKIFFQKKNIIANDGFFPKF